MSSVHYKFKATLEYKTLTFDGLHIGVDELKKAICDKENIRTESFDLLLTNAHTKREYTAGELVPRNSSVVIQRVPRENAQRLPKVQDTSTSGILTRNIVIGFQSQNSYIKPEEFAGMTEDQRLAHIKRVSTEKYSSANYQKRTGIMTGPPPATYVCNRCGQAGHWYKSCPLLNVRRTAGITMDELMETHRDDPLAMIHPSGKFVKPIMHHQARLQRKHEPFPGQPDESAGQSPGQQSACQDVVPDQFKCRLCGGVLRDAVLAACCGHSFCAECYQQQLLAHPTERCPGPDCAQQISADSLVPNKMLRDAVQKFSAGGVDLAMMMQEQQQTAGVNKPNILTDTNSLLHKLLPGLANSQARRAMDTNYSVPSAAATTFSGVASNGPTTAQQQAEATPPLPRTNLQQPQTSKTITEPQSKDAPPASTTSAFVSNAEQTTITYTPSPIITTTTIATSFQQQQQQIQVPQPQQLPLFDPNKPPPPITGMVAPSSVMGGMTNLSSTLFQQASLPQPTSSLFPASAATSSALSAEDSLSAWESFLQRKEDEKAERNMMRNNSYQQQRSLLESIGSRDRDSGRVQRERDHRHYRDHRDHNHHRSRRESDGRDKDSEEEADVEEEKRTKPTKLSVEEMSSAWKAFEKHSVEKKTNIVVTKLGTLTKITAEKEEEEKERTVEEKVVREEEDEKAKEKEEEDKKEDDAMKEEEEEENMEEKKKERGGAKKKKERKEKKEVKQKHPHRYRSRDHRELEHHHHPRHGDKRRRSSRSGSRKRTKLEEKTDEKKKEKTDEKKKEKKKTAEKGEVKKSDKKKEEGEEKDARRKKEEKREEDKREEEKRKSVDEEKQESRSKREKEEANRRRISPPAAGSTPVNQLDLALAQHHAGWRAGRLRHAPQHSPPNFEDTDRWRPIPEVQVMNEVSRHLKIRTETPTTGDELFINMGKEASVHLLRENRRKTAKEDEVKRKNNNSGKKEKSRKKNRK